MSETLKLADLKFGGDSTGFTAEHFPGNRFNEPSVWLEIGSGEIHYDRDYGIETPITGSYDLDFNEAKKLHRFLGEFLEQAKDWKRPAKLHELKKHTEGVSDKVLQAWIADGKVWITADGTLIADNITGLRQAVMKDMEK